MKPIHKFNGGRGATLCHVCNKMISEGMTNALYCEEHGGGQPLKYKITKEENGKVINANKIEFVEWADPYSKGSSEKTIINEARIGSSLITDRSAVTFGWLTTPITEILENRENYIKFKTENSTYVINIRQD